MAECPPGLPFPVPSAVLYPSRVISWFQLWLWAASSLSWGVEPRGCSAFGSALSITPAEVSDHSLPAHPTPAAATKLWSALLGMGPAKPRAGTLVFWEGQQSPSLVGRVSQRELLPEGSLFLTQQGICSAKQREHPVTLRVGIRFLPKDSNGMCF